MEFYRYKTVNYASIDRDGEFYTPSVPNPKLELETYTMFKETPKGYWIGFGSDDFNSKYSFKKWVSKTSRKRFAYPSKKEALISFIIRTEKRIKILEYTAWDCKIGLSMAKDKLIILNQLY